MPLPSFIIVHINKATNRLLDNGNSIEIIHAYISLMSLVVELTLTYLCLVIFALSLVSLHYFKQRLGILLSIVCILVSLFILSTRSYYSANNN